MNERTVNFRTIGNAALDLLFPPSLYCNCCGNVIDESRTYNLCDHCIAHIRWDGSPVKDLGGLNVLRCTEYGLYERTLIFALKYNGKTYIARDIAQIMADRLSLAEISFDVIVPVPMYAAKERKRGFNHAALIGKYLGRLVSKPHLAHGLLRMDNTLPMRGLSPTERSQNVKGKFAINEKYVKMLKGKKILLLDDFYTTGSTALECYSALKRAGAADVYLLAFAAR